MTTIKELSSLKTENTLETSWLFIGKAFMILLDVCCFGCFECTVLTLHHYLYHLDKPLLTSQHLRFVQFRSLSYCPFQQMDFKIIFTVLYQIKGHSALRPILQNNDKTNY